MYDERLVRAAQEGDEAAFAALYDRAVDAVYDLCWALTGDAEEAGRIVEAAFVLAARNLDQLSDPSQVKPWLLAIAGDQALADEQDGVLRSGWDDHPADGGDTEPLGPQALRRWAADAAAVLALPDQLVLELQLRHDLDPEQLAAAVGCSVAQLPDILERVDEEATSVLSALVLARQGRKNCPQLASLLAGWDGAPSVEVADAADAHAKTCTRCARRRKLANPLELVTEAPVVAAPASIRGPILEHVARVVPATSTSVVPAATSAVTVASADDEPPARRSLAALIGAAAMLVVLIVAVVIALSLGSGKKTGGTPAQASATTLADAGAAPTLVPLDTSTSSTTLPGTLLQLNASRVDMGSVARTVTLSLSNAGSTAAQWTASSTADWLTVTPASSSLGPGQTTHVVLTIDRSVAPRQFDARVIFAGSDQGARSATVEVVGTNTPTPTTVYYAPTTVPVTTTEPSTTTSSPALLPHASPPTTTASGPTTTAP